MTYIIPAGAPVEVFILGYWTKIKLREQVVFEKNNIRVKSTTKTTFAFPNAPEIIVTNKFIQEI